MNNINLHKEQRSNYYSIRKYSVGTASILLGTLLIFGQQQQAQAAEDKTQSQTLEQHVPQSQNILSKEEVDAQLKTQDTDTKLNNSVVSANNHSSVATEQHKNLMDNDSKMVHINEVPQASKTQYTPANKAVSAPLNSTQATPTSKQPVKYSNQSQASADDWLSPNNTHMDTPQQEKNKVSQMSWGTKDVAQSSPTVENGQTDEGVKGQEHVTKTNFADHFRVIGNTSWYNPNTGIITLTDDTNNLISAAYLTSKLDISQGFHLNGKVNLGHRSMAQNSGNGVSFILSPNSPGEIGKAGPAAGIGGLKNAFGFKLDTKFDEQDSSYAKADPSYFNRLGAFGGFIHTTNDYRHKAITHESNNGSETVKLLKGKPKNNLFYPFSLDFNPKTAMLKVWYEGQTWERNISDWLRLSKTTKFNLTIFASTGPNGSNKQQFKFGSLKYVPASTVYVQYKDAETGENIARPNYLSGKAGDTITIDHLRKDVTDNKYEFVTAEGPVQNNVVTFTRANQIIILKYKMKKAAQLMDNNDSVEPQQPSVNTITTKTKEIIGTTAKNTEVKVVFPDGYTVHVQEDGTGRFSVIVPFGKRLMAGDTIQISAKNRAGKVSKISQVTVMNPGVANSQVKPMPQAKPQQLDQLKQNSTTSQQMDDASMAKPSQPMTQGMDKGNKQPNQNGMKDEKMPMSPKNTRDMAKPSQPMLQGMNKENKQPNQNGMKDEKMPMAPKKTGDMGKPSQPMPQAIDKGNKQPNPNEMKDEKMPMAPKHTVDMVKPSQPMPQGMDKGNKQSNQSGMIDEKMPMAPKHTVDMVKSNQPMPHAMDKGSKQSNPIEMKDKKIPMEPENKAGMVKEKHMTTQSKTSATVKLMSDMPEKKALMWKTKTPATTTIEKSQPVSTMKMKAWKDHKEQQTLPKTGNHEGTKTIFASFFAMLGGLLLTGRNRRVQGESNCFKHQQ